MLRIANFAARWLLVFKSAQKSRFWVFLVRIVNGFNDWGLVQRFTFVSTIVMLLGMIGIGWWVDKQIETRVIREATIETALYMDSFVAPNIQELGHSNSITPEHAADLDNLFNETNLGNRTVSVKIWSKDHYIIYSNIPALVGRTFPDTADQAASWAGEVTGDISNLSEEENVEERRLSSDPLFQIYSPVRLNGTHEIIAVAEFYQKVDTLEAEIAAAKRWGWLLVGISILVVYFVLVGFVYWASQRIEQQGAELKNQVKQLTLLLSHNKELTKRVRLAAANTAALNESLLRRTSAEIHDGPVQEISLALLRLDQAMERNESCRVTNPNSKCNDSLPVVQTSLQAALQGMRTIAAGLGIPQLDDLTLPGVIERVIRSHELHTETKVAFNMSDIPDQATLSTKIIIYRFIQEGLNNAYQHAGGKGQAVQVIYRAQQLQIEVSDQGPGFDISQTTDEQLGLVGMRESVESLGGFFIIDSKINLGTKLTARLSLQPIGDRITNGQDSTRDHRRPSDFSRGGRFHSWF
jgi:signal transduction histidine kinase